MKTWAPGALLVTVASCAGRAPSRAPLSIGDAPAAVEQPGETAQLPRAALDGLRITLQNPKRDLPKLSGFVPDPSVAQLLFEPRLALPSAVGEAAAHVVDLSRPVGLALGIGDDPPIAMAFSVNDADARTLRGRRVAPGRVRLEPAEGARLGSCELWQLGSSALRLLCGTNDGALNSLAPVLLQTEPLASTAALRLDVGGASYRQLIATRIVAEADKKAATETGGERLGRELAESIIVHDRLSLELSLLPDGLELALSLGYDDVARSPLLRGWLAGSLAPPPLPPAGTERGFWLGYAGTERGAFAPLEEQLLKAFSDEEAATTYATPAQIQQMRGVLAAVVPDTGRFSFASGQNLEAAQSALAQSDKHKATLAERQKLERALASWSLIGIDQPPAPYIEAIKTGLKLNKIRDKSVPGKKSEQRATKSETRLAPATAKDLPPGTLHLIEDVRANPKFVPSAEHPREDAHVQHLLVVPDGQRVWIVISRSEQVAAATARGALAHTSEPARPAAGAAHPLFALRMTAAGLVGLGASFDNEQETRSARDALSALVALPHHGEDELLVFGEVRRASNAGAQSFDLRLSARLTNDAASAWLQWLMMTTSRKPRSAAE